MGKLANKLAVLRRKAKHLDEKIEALAKTCPHPSYHVGWWSWRLGSMDAMRICNECMLSIGDPSPDENREFRLTHWKRRRLSLIAEGFSPDEIREILGPNLWELT